MSASLPRRSPTSSSTPRLRRTTLGDDLFPSDFIHLLKPPDNYIGASAIFPYLDPENEEDAPSIGGMISSLDDAEDWIPAGHKKDHEIDGLPESLLTALRCFLLACAIRDLRADAKELWSGGGVHRSMLVNVSQFTAVQNRVAVALHDELEEIRRAVRLNGALASPEAEDRSPKIRDLAVTFASEFEACGQTWPTVLAMLHSSMAPVRVQAVNQSTGARSLDYSTTSVPPGVRIIAVGGNSLSRGLTLEGLSTSYFLRNSKAYDTLLQMGRWFGYRDGYGDLCRLWLTRDAEGWYRHVTRATEELKQDFMRMKRRRATPSEFGLRVRTHPDTLLITARNKMASGLDVVVERDISLVGQMVETAKLWSDRSRTTTNVHAIDRFLEALSASGNGPVESPHGDALLWVDVSAAKVADLVDEFLVHPMDHDFQGEAVSRFIRDGAVAGGGPSVGWTVAIPTNGKRDAVTELKALKDNKVLAARRGVRVTEARNVVQVSGRSARVGSRSDLRHGFSVWQYEELKKVGDTEKEADLRSKMDAPLLMIHLLRGHTDPDRVQLYRDGMLLPALGIHFPGKMDLASKQKLVRYRLNTTAQKELMPEADDIGDDALDGDEDDD